MLTSKQRAKLKSYANSMETILHIGKGGVTDTVITQAQEALLKREMIKGRVLDNSLLTAKETAAELAESVDCEVVQVIGTRFVLYKKIEKEPIYQID